MTKPSDPMTKSSDPLFKILILGDSEVGKTTLISRYTNNKFKFSNHNEYKSSIAVDFLTKELKHNETNVTLQIWDTPGEGKTRKKTNTVSFSKAFFQGADGIILTFDITDEISLKNAEEFWLKQIDSDLPLLLVGCKSDLQDKRQVASSEAKKCAERIGATYFEVSAKHGVNIDMAFEDLKTKMYKRVVDKSSSENKEQTKNINYTAAVSDLGKKCKSYQDYLTTQLNSIIKKEKKNSDSHASIVKLLDPNQLLDVEKAEKNIKDMDAYFQSEPSTPNQKKLLGTAKKMLSVAKLIKTLETGNDEEKFKNFKIEFNKKDVQDPLNVYSDSATKRFLRFLLGIINPVYAYKRAKVTGFPFWRSGTKTFFEKTTKKVNPESTFTPTKR